MITCPECGQLAQDNAKFCDRCGRALANASSPASSASRPEPRAKGAMLKGGYEIVEVLPGTSIENRYLTRRNQNGSEASFIIRERFRDERSEPEQHESSPARQQPSPPEENPSSPTAKTAELKAPPELRAAAQAEGAIAETAASESAEISPSPGGRTEGGEVTGSNGSGDHFGAADGAKDETVPAQDSAIESGNDLGEVFGRVLALSMTLNHPAFQRAVEGFAEENRVYLVYPDESLASVTQGSPKLNEPAAISAAVQVCQAIAFVHRRGLRLNDICPASVAVTRAGRIKMTGLDYVSNDNELQAEPIFNDGYTAPEIYRGRKVDKRADIFSAGALLYTWLTGERLESESWREEAGVVRFYPPHVITPELEQAVRRALLFDAKDRWPSIDEFKAELTKLLGDVRLSAAVLTDVGMVRDHNEDAVMAVEYTRDSLMDPAQNYLYVVCDGMGGAEAGEVAAAIAVSTIRSFVSERLAKPDGRDSSQLMVGALEEANSKILEYQSAHPESRGMGSTGVAVLAKPPEIGLGWVGDSRGYILDGSSLRQITKDHSLVQRLVEIGQITAEEAKHHEHKNVITRSLGARPNGPAGAEGAIFRLKRGDRMLLCSDGLTAHVDDPDIARILRRHSNPDEAARELIAAANAGGGTDNISVVVVFAN